MAVEVFVGSVMVVVTEEIEAAVAIIAMITVLMMKTVSVSLKFNLIFKKIIAGCGTLVYSGTLLLVRI